MATDAAGRVYVADAGNDRVEVFSGSGKFLDEWGVHGKAPGQFDSPVAIAAAAGGKVFVADAGNDRIQVFGKLSKPQYGKSVNLGVVSGVIRVHLPGSTKFIVLGTDQQLPVGTIVDASHGRVRLSSAKGPGGGTQSADFYSGAFRVLQPKGGKPITVLKLENGLVCPVEEGQARARRRLRPIQEPRPLGQRQGQLPLGRQTRLGHGAGHDLVGAGHLQGHPLQSQEGRRHDQGLHQRQDPEAPRRPALPGAQRLMRSRQVRRARMIGLLAVAAISVGIGVLAYATDLFRTLDLNTVDTRFSIRGTQERPDDIVVVGIDDKTFNALTSSGPSRAISTPS